MTLSDLPQVKALSLREKLSLADELWTEAAQASQTVEVTAEEKQILDERWARHLKDPSSTLTLVQLETRIKSLRQRRVFASSRK